MGTGCPKCKRTEANVRQALSKLGLNAEVIDVTDINEIVARGVLRTPAVFIDGVKVIEGRIATEKDIMDFLKK